MEVGVKVQMSTESVSYDHNHQLSTVSLFRPLVNYGCTQRWQVIEKMAVAAKYRPEDIGHGKDDAGKLNVRQRHPHLALP